MPRTRRTSVLILVVAAALGGCTSAKQAAPTLPPLPTTNLPTTTSLVVTVPGFATSTTIIATVPPSTVLPTTTGLAITVPATTVPTTTVPTTTGAPTTVSGATTTTVAGTTTTGASLGPREKAETWIMQLGSAPTGATDAAVQAELKRFASVTAGVKALRTGDWPKTFPGASRVIFYVGGFGSKDGVIARCGQLGLAYPDNCLARFLTDG